MLNLGKNSFAGSLLRVLICMAATCLACAASVYDAGLYTQVPMEHLSDANRATYIADAKAAGVDAVWLSMTDFFVRGAKRQAELDRLASEIRNFENAGFSVGVWINGFGYGNERPFFKDSMKITTLEGKAKGGAVCPLDPLLRQALRDNVRGVAQAGAKFILMDDDYVQSARSLVGCSCPLHLARVAAKCGREKVTAEEVKRAFTGGPNALRTAYLDVGGEVAIELAHELRREVDAVDPSIGMGLCASYTHWDVEGCDLLELVGAFAGSGRKVLRISGAPYWRNAKIPGTGLADIIEFVRMQSAWTRGLDMTVFDENDPYPRKAALVPAWLCELYDKAVIADGHLARHKYMLCYGPDRKEPAYLEAHIANMPDDAKLRRIFAGTEPYGVKVACPQHRLRTATLPTPFAGESQITALYSQPAAAFELRRKGIPTRFDGPDKSDEPLAVTVKAPSPDVYQIVHCDRAKGEYAVLLENMGKKSARVKIAVVGAVDVLSSLRGDFKPVSGGLEIADLPPHGYAAVRFAVRGGRNVQEQLTVLSWNTQHYDWERRSEEERGRLEDNMFKLVRAVNPDVFLMQETYGSFERFKAALPGYDARLLGRCNCIFSRFPIIATHEPYREKGNYGEPEGGAFNIQVTELDAGCMRLRVCPMAMFWLPYCVKTPSGMTPDELLAWENARQKYDAAPRPQAISGILAGMAPFLAERDEVPVVVAGDFNCHSHLDWTPATGSWPGHEGRTVPWQVSTRMLSAGFTDVFRALYPDPAANYGATFPVPGVMPQHAEPFLRLDYVYSAGEKLVPQSMEVISGPYHRPFTWRGHSFTSFPSDHAAVLARFAVDTCGKNFRR